MVRILGGMPASNLCSVLITKSILRWRQNPPPFIMLLLGRGCSVFHFKSVYFYPCFNLYIVFYMIILKINFKNNKKLF
jgi:hypothetical protein